MIDGMGFGRRSGVGAGTDILKKERKRKKERE